MSIVKPYIQRRYEGKAPVEWTFINRRRPLVAEEICRYLRATTEEDKRKYEFSYYCGLTEILRESKRILLYIPLESLKKDAPDSFREAYMEAWRALLDERDERENFHEGDCFEPDARPDDGLEYTVKCLHLLPWIVEAGYISFLDILRITKEHLDDEVFFLGMNEAFLVMKKRGSITFSETGINTENLWQFGDFFAKSSTRERNLIYTVINWEVKRKKPMPKYVSEARLAWLNEKNREPSELFTPKVDLADPFGEDSEVWEKTWPIFQEIESKLNPGETILVSGSRLKGYGTVESDWDGFDYATLQNLANASAGHPEAIHLYLDSVWISKSEESELKDQMDSVAKKYHTQYKDREKCKKRLESDLLQYRLLHKGYARVARKKEFPTSIYPEIDGDCAFYDDEYRKIATMLYAKYVYL